MTITEGNFSSGPRLFQLILAESRSGQSFLAEPHLTQSFFVESRSAQPFFDNPHEPPLSILAAVYFGYFY